eukprot:SAG31_NODE_3188_length_4574_cov_2.395978_5_plen_222_part_00
MFGYHRIVSLQAELEVKEEDASKWAEYANTRAVQIEQEVFKFRSETEGLRGDLAAALAAKAAAERRVATAEAVATTTADGIAAVQQSVPGEFRRLMSEIRMCFEAREAQTNRELADERGMMTRQMAGMEAASAGLREELLTTRRSNERLQHELQATQTQCRVAEASAMMAADQADRRAAAEAAVQHELQSSAVAEKQLRDDLTQLERCVENLGNAAPNLST